MPTILAMLLQGVAAAVTEAGVLLVVIPVAILGYETFVALIKHTFGEERSRKY